MDEALPTLSATEIARILRQVLTDRQLVSGDTKDDLDRVDAVVAAMTEAERARPEALLEDGPRVAEIAEAVGCSAEAVERILGLILMVKLLAHDKLASAEGQQRLYDAMLGEHMASLKKMRSIRRVENLPDAPPTRSKADEVVMAMFLKSAPGPRSPEDGNDDG